MFVGRRDDSSIYGLWSVQQWDGQESLPDDDAEVLAFRSQVPAQLTAEQKLAAIGLTPDQLKQALGLT